MPNTLSRLSSTSSSYPDILGYERELNVLYSFAYTTTALVELYNNLKK